MLEGNAKQDLPDMASYPNCMHFRLIWVEQPAENSFKESALNASKMAQYELIHIMFSYAFKHYGHARKIKETIRKADISKAEY